MGTRKAFHNLSRSRQYYHRKQLLDLLGNENEPEHPFGNGAQHGRHADSDSDSDEAVQPPRQRRRNHVECDADQVGQQRGNEDGEGQGDASENQQSDTDSDISLEDPVEEPQPQQQRNDVILSDNEGDHEDGGSADEVQGDANQNEENHSSSSENENNDEETENEGSDTEVDDDEETENEGSDTEDDDDEETENEGSENGDEAEEVQNVNNGNLFNPDGGNGNRLNPNMPFYHGAPLTMGESLLLILTMVLKHNITGTCLADLLTLIHLHCIRQGLKKVSLYKFRKFFSISKEPIIKHFFCSKCMIPLADVDAVCGTCPPQKRKSYFLEMDIGSQLQHLYLRNDFHGMLQHRFNRNRPAGIADIYDGQLYKAQVENGFLSNANNISFSWYTDGVIVYKSSQISIWPLYLTINELPYHQRIKKENTILAGLWFGPKKPSANYFVRSLRNQFQTLYHGKEFSLHNGNIINVRAILLAGVCDLVAKANFLNMEAHNAVHGCPNCLIATRDVLTRNETHTRAYPYVPNPRMRTVEEFTRSARNALNLGEPVNGVKGPCALSKIMPDFLLGTAIDPMHGIYGGVFKKIMTMCFSEDFAGCPFSLSLVTNIVDQRLLSIKPPKFIHRMPRSVKEICHWKTSELKTFFFFYALPVLSGIMRADWYENLTCLITAVTLLNSDDITQIMFNNAKTLLKKFVREFEQLYGIEYCSLNVHQLLHIPSCVSNLGNLWVFSCFPYEDLNGKFVKLVHGQTNVDSQIVASHALILKSKRKFDALPHGEVRDFCHGRKKMVKLIEMLFDGCYSVGKYNTLAEIPGFIRDALRAANLNFNRVMAYKRLLKDKKIYVSETYNRDVETVSSYVAYSENNDLLFGSINTFLKLTNCECLNNCLCPGEHFAILNIVVTEAQFHATGDRGLQIVLPHIFKCHRANVYVCIPVSILKTVCMYMSVENQSYIAHPVNSMEQE